jgi:protein phosphatase
MAEVLLGSDSNPGGRKYNEDRCAVEHLVTRSGLRLDVAVVCDGVGGEEYGERAAQLAVDTVLASLRSSEETDVPWLITVAVRPPTRRSSQKPNA